MHPFVPMQVQNFPVILHTYLTSHDTLSNQGTNSDQMVQFSHIQNEDYHSVLR